MKATRYECRTQIFFYPRERRHDGESNIEEKGVIHQAGVTFFFFYVNLSHSSMHYGGGKKKNVQNL